MSQPRYTLFEACNASRNCGSAEIQESGLLGTTPGCGKGINASCGDAEFRIIRSIKASGCDATCGSSDLFVARYFTSSAVSCNGNCGSAALMAGPIMSATALSGFIASIGMAEVFSAALADAGKISMTRKHFGS